MMKELRVTSYLPATAYATACQSLSDMIHWIFKIGQTKLRECKWKVKQQQLLCMYKFYFHHCSSYKQFLSQLIKQETQESFDLNENIFRCVHRIMLQIYFPNIFHKTELDNLVPLGIACQSWICFVTCKLAFHVCTTSFLTQNRPKLLSNFIFLKFSNKLGAHL